MHSGTGELLRTDGAATWTRQAGQPALPAIGTIHFLTRQVGYLDAISSMWNLGWWTTEDSGQSWTRLQLPTPTAKRSDSVNIIDAPALAGDAIVLAADFTTPGAGNDDGVGSYRSTDQGTSWTVQELASETPTEGYDFAASPDGSSYLLLRAQSGADSQTATWVTSLSTDGGHRFTDRTGADNFYPGPVTLAGPGNLWTVGGAQRSGQLADEDGGTGQQLAAQR